MSIFFYIFAAITVLAALNMVLQRTPVYSALSLIVVLCSLAGVYLQLGAEFMAVIQVIVYAGAIMVLFLFALMLLNLGPQAERQERGWLRIRAWVGPGLSSLALLTELVYW